MASFRPRNPTPSAALFRYHREDLLNSSCGSIDFDFDDASSFIDDVDVDDGDCELAIFMAPVAAHPVQHLSRRFALPTYKREHTPFLAPTRPRNPTPYRASDKNVEADSIVGVSRPVRRPRNPTPAQAQRSMVAKKPKVVRPQRISTATSSPQCTPRSAFSRHSSSGFGSSSPFLLSTTPIFGKSPSPFPTSCWQESLNLDHDSPFVFSASMKHQQLLACLNTGFCA